MRHTEKINPNGHFRVCLEAMRDGASIPISEARLAVDNLPGRRQGGRQIIEKDNLVVNDGRQTIARLLGNQTASHLDRLIVGTGPKGNNIPNLQDSGLVQELQDSDGNLSGKFVLDYDTEVFFPARTGRFPSDPTVEWGSADGAVEVDSTTQQSLLKDNTVNFFTIGVQKTDQVTIDNDPDNPLVLQIRQIVDKHTLEVYNPNDYTTPSSETIQYRIDTPGTQMLISKLLQGNDFPESDFGKVTILHEAGLLFNDGTLFNRVVFVPSDEGAGLVAQPNTNTHDELNIRFEVVITL